MKKSKLKVIRVKFREHDVPEDQSALVPIQILCFENQEQIIETVWALPEGQNFRIKSIPFEITYSFNDLIAVEKVGQILQYTELLEPSVYKTKVYNMVDRKKLDKFKEQLTVYKYRWEVEKGNPQVFVSRRTSESQKVDALRDEVLFGIKSVEHPFKTSFNVVR